MVAHAARLCHCWHSPSLAFAHDWLRQALTIGAQHSCGCATQHKRLCCINAWSGQVTGCVVLHPTKRRCCSVCADAEPAVQHGWASGYVAGPSIGECMLWRVGKLHSMGCHLLTSLRAQCNREPVTAWPAVVTGCQVTPRAQPPGHHLCATERPRNSRHLAPQL
jgi:hypothetical protein